MNKDAVALGLSIQPVVLQPQRYPTSYSIIAPSGLPILLLDGTLRQPHDEAACFMVQQQDRGMPVHGHIIPGGAEKALWKCP